MATSSISRFNLDIADVMEEAFERIGRELRSGYDVITARRSLNLVCQDMINKGINLWTVEQTDLALAQGTQVYQLDDDTSDVLPSAVIRVLQTDGSYRDLNCERWMRDEWLAMPNKAQTGRPYKFLVERLRDNPQLTFWPVPDIGTYVFTYWRVRYMEDTTDPTYTPDMPRRFLPALISGLAFHLANKAPGQVDINRRAELKNLYDEDLKIAMFEDHDRSSAFILPSLRRY